MTVWSLPWLPGKDQICRPWSCDAMRRFDHQNTFCRLRRQGYWILVLRVGSDQLLYRPLDPLWQERVEKIPWLQRLGWRAIFNQAIRILFLVDKKTSSTWSSCSSSGASSSYKLSDDDVELGLNSVIFADDPIHHKSI